MTKDEDRYNSLPYLISCKVHDSWGDIDVAIFCNKR